MTGTTVNRRYTIERKIGDGGMAEVFLGFDEMLHRPVAIKSLRGQYAADATFRTRFEREAQAAASFSHPNIIDIYDVGEDRGVPYIVMEYVPGETLKDIIDNEGPFDADDVAILVEQVASALDYAHERGFVHRDIKPQNILVDGDGLAKVVDFGIAKGLADATLTEAGAGLGTVHYVSPEQASGLMATPSSDIYSLAVVAYEMLTGRLPFESDSAVGIAMKHINEDAKHPSLLNKHVPRAAGDIVHRALSKDPTKRYTTAGTFAHALNEWRGAAPNGAAPPRPAPPLEPKEPAIWLPPGQRIVRPEPTRHTINQPAPRAVPAPSIPRVPTPTRLPAADQTSVADPLASEEERSRAGCASWVVGAGVIAVVAVLIWFGSTLSGQFGSNGSNTDPTPTRAAELAVDPPTPTPTPEPTAENSPTPRIVSSEPTTGPGPSSVETPNLIGLTEEEALAELDRYDLVLERGGTETSTDVEEGRVTDQEPSTGTPLDRGSSVLVTISAGPPVYDLASLDLIGTEPDDATRTLESMSLSVARRDVGSPDIAAGLVAGTEPADTVRPGDTVTLLISAGDVVQIPVELQGMPLDEARARLADLGLTVAAEIAVSTATLANAGIDNPESVGIDSGDVVGIQDSDAVFGGFVQPGVSVTLVYYDSNLID